MFIHGKQGIKKGVRIKIQPRFKIQYPMKNRGKDIRKHSHPQDVKAITPESLIIFYQLFRNYGVCRFICRLQNITTSL